jgi:hypothetical protein
LPRVYAKRTRRLLRFVLVIFVFFVLGLLLTLAPFHVFRHLHPAPPLAQNQDARALTQTEASTFLPLVCASPSKAPDAEYQAQCTSIQGYPDPSIAAPNNEIALTSIAYGDFTGPNQAYISYLGSFEPHATNFGGGILFNQTATGWALASWYPGGQLDGCLALNPLGAAKYLCDLGYTGQGETDTTLFIVTVPPAAAGTAGQTNLAKILAASDLRETGSPNDNCTLRTSPTQAVLLSIDSLKRGPAPAFATAGITFVTAADATTACASNAFADAPTTSGALTLSWDGTQLTIAPSLNFAPAQ